eukprot:368935_1
MNPTSNNKITGFSLLPPIIVNKDKNNLSINASYHASIEFIQRAGIAAKLPMKTINTAIMIFLRYFASSTISINDNSSTHSINDICRCSLYVSSKIEETPCRLRDIMNATYKLTFPSQPLLNPNTTDWHEWKDKLIKLESIILNEINFEFNAVHPHQFVLHQCNELKTSVNIAKLSWSICNDCMYKRNIMLSYKPHEISAAAIYIASEFLSHTQMEYTNKNSNNNDNISPTSPHGIHHGLYDGTKQNNWWRKFDIDDDILQSICCLIMDLYESPFAKWKNDKNGNKKYMENVNGNVSDDELNIIKCKGSLKKGNDKYNNKHEISDNEDNDIKM